MMEMTVHNKPVSFFVPCAGAAGTTVVALTTGEDCFFVLGEGVFPAGFCVFVEGVAGCGVVGFFFEADFFPLDGVLDPS